MGKSENGPDMLDCLTYLREIEESRTLSVTVLLEPDGFGAGPRWRIHVLAVPKLGTLTDGAVGVATGALWPHRNHLTFTGAFFSALARLDSELGREEFVKILGIA